jgi:hypothetical protein
VGDGEEGWTCLGFAIDDQHRDACLNRCGVTSVVPVSGDGTLAKWAIMARREQK